jgi:LasA protease
MAQPFIPPTTAPSLTPKPSLTPFTTPTHQPGALLLSPTPDLPHAVPTLRTTQATYTVQSGDSLGKIAVQFSIPVDQLMTANQIINPDRIDVGQVLVIPVPSPEPPGPDFKILPDSELVDGPAAAHFDLTSFVMDKAGYLALYSGDVDSEILNGADIVALVAEDYSVNPRLLLAVLEYQSGWVTNANPDQKTNVVGTTIDYPLGYTDANRKGLYKQMAYAADNLNRGYYLWRANALSSYVLTDNSIIPVAPTLNAGTVGVQYLMSLLYGQADWEQAITAKGLAATYQGLFGNPFDYAVEPILPADLKQPSMQLPFAVGDVWAFTGGPHGGWGEGSAWAALDFAPPGGAAGCTQSDAWVVAVAPGLIVRSDHGAVVENLSGDPYVQTGWTILYMHIETRDRINLGVTVKAGDRIGHPSCEGGVSNGTHTHLARRYNGEWIPADGPLPFNLDGWISSGTGTEYDGFLTRNEQKIEAWDDRRTAENEIQR